MLFDAGKHVFCEKSIGFTMEECFRIYSKHISTGKIFFTGQQRLFDPRYIKVMEMIHAGTFGDDKRHPYFFGTGMETGGGKCLHLIWNV